MIMHGIDILFHADLSNYTNIFLSIRSRKGEWAEYLKQIYESLTVKITLELLLNSSVIVFSSLHLCTHHKTIMPMWKIRQN